jgi:hypothetical protein
MERGRHAELDVTNEDHRVHAVNIQSNGARQCFGCRRRRAREIRDPARYARMYWFGCPVENHGTAACSASSFVKAKCRPKRGSTAPASPSRQQETAPCAPA